MLRDYSYWWIRQHVVCWGEVCYYSIFIIDQTWLSAQFPPDGRYNEWKESHTFPMKEQPKPFILRSGSFDTWKTLVSQLQRTRNDLGKDPFLVSISKQINYKSSAEMHRASNIFLKQSIVQHHLCPFNSSITVNVNYENHTWDRRTFPNSIHKRMSCERLVFLWHSASPLQLLLLLVTMATTTQPVPKL